MRYFDEYDNDPVVQLHVWLVRVLTALIGVVAAVAVVGLCVSIWMASWDAQIAGGWFVK